jgi:hypothetical protein
VSKIVFVCFILFGSLRAQEFPLGIWFTGNQRALDSVAALGCNWVQAYCGWDSSDSRKHYEFILKNEHGIKVIALIESHLQNPSLAQRLVYEAEQPADSTGVENYFARLSQTAGAASGKYWRALPAEHAPGYLAKDPRPNDLLLYNRREWLAAFLMKISPTGAGATPVARLEIANHETLLAQSEVWEKDFSSSKPRAFELRFTLPANYGAAALDLRVWWHGRVETYLDAVILEDFVEEAGRPYLSGAHQLFRGKRDAEIIAAAKRFASAKDYPLVQRFYLKDEPMHNGHQAFRYVDELIRKRAKFDAADQGRGRAITATPNYTQNTPQREASFERVMREAKPHELFVDAYPIHADLPADTMYMPLLAAHNAGVAAFTSHENYSAQLQGAFDYMIANTLLPAIHAAQRHRVAWWFIAQAHGELCESTGQYRRGDNNGAMLRPPSPAEIRAMVYLALAHGAKGIFYFAYPTFGDANFGGCTPARFPGLIALDGNSKLPPAPNAIPQHDSDYDTFAGRRVFTGYRQKYEGVRGLNAELQRLGPMLLPLQWQASYSAHQDHERPLLREHGFEDLVSTSLQGERDAASATFVEAGIFRERKAFFYLIVNRRCEANGARTITLRLRGHPQKASVVTNMWNGVQQKFSAPAFSYELALHPGEAALLRRAEE